MANFERFKNGSPADLIVLMVIGMVLSMMIYCGVMLRYESKVRDKYRGKQYLINYEEYTVMNTTVTLTLQVRGKMFCFTSGKTIENYRLD